MLGAAGQYILLAIGLLLLVGGAEGLVRGGVGLARCFGVSPLLVGLTIVAWGTSAPELVVSLQAAYSGAADITLGNVVGSNVFNVLAILGVSALIRPIKCQPRAIARDMVAGLLAALAVVWMAHYNSHFTAVYGAILVSGLIAYSLVVYRMERGVRSPAKRLIVEEVKVHEPIPRAIWADILLLMLGLGALIFGSKLLVDNAVVIARSWGVSEALIGLTLVAAGTSMPELATSAVAAFRGQSEIALGNVLGSNIYNLLAILGVTALIVPVPVPARIAAFDIYLLFGVALAAMLPLITGGRLSRIGGFVFLSLYFLYLGELVYQSA